MKLNKYIIRKETSGILNSNNSGLKPRNYGQSPTNHPCKIENIMDADEQRIKNRENILKVMEETFVMVPAKLLRDVAEGKITSSAFYVYCYLLFRRGKKGNFWGSVKDISWGTGFSEPQVSRHFEQLVTRGHIKRVKRVGKTSLTYCLTRVEDEGKIVFRGGLRGDTFIDSTLNTNSKSKQSSAEFHSEKPASENDIAEASRVFNEIVPSDGTSEDARLDRVEREIDEIFNKP